MSKKIIIIGSYPPPYGGISVHIERVLLYLKKDEYVFYNEQKSSCPNAKSFNNKWKYCKAFSFLFKKFKLIHYHTPNNRMRTIFYFIGAVKKKIYIHIHGESIHDFIERNYVNCFLIKFFLQFVDILADNEKIADYLKPFRPKSIQVIDAFIPPKFDLKILRDFNNSYPVINNDILISHVGWFSTYNKVDLYGYDLLLEALRILIENFHLSVSITSSVNGIKELNLYNNFLATRKQYNLDERFKLVLENVKQIWPLFLQSSIFIRPTVSDGSSVALREALWFECIALASDAVPRPDKVILFQNRSAHDLADKVAEVIKNQKFLSLDEKIDLIRSKKFKCKLFEEIYGIKR